MCHRRPRLLLELLPGCLLAQEWLCCALSQGDKGSSPLLCLLEKDSSRAPVDWTEDGEQRSAMALLFHLCQSLRPGWCLAALAVGEDKAYLQQPHLTPPIPPSLVSRSSQCLCKASSCPGRVFLAGTARSWPQPFAWGAVSSHLPQSQPSGPIPWHARASTISTSPHPLFPLVHAACLHMLTVSKKGAYQKQLCSQKGSLLPISSGQKKSVSLPTKAVGTV